MEDVESLKKELYDLFKLIQRIRVEIASIKSPQDHFTEMSDQLDAIVGSTAIATNDIMENVERINDIAFELKKGAGEAQQKQLDEVIERVGNVIVSCSFQDITGQRVSKIVKAVRYIESRINALIAMWGQDQIASEQVDKPEETDEYKKYLHGPALSGQGLSQSDADAIMKGKAPATPAAAEPAKKTTAAPAPVSEPKKEEPPAKESSENPLDQSSIDALFG